MDIARRSGISQPNISRIVTDVHDDMKYRDGKRIEALVIEVCPSLHPELIQKRAKRTAKNLPAEQSALSGS
jgi:hypothetical protein